MLSKILAKYGIDNLELEMELTSGIRDFIGDKTVHQSEAVMKSTIAKAIQLSGQAADVRINIMETIQSKLQMNPSSIDGENFVEFAFLRAAHGEDILTFCAWWIQNNDDPKYWSFKRMREMWPKAFPRHVTAEPVEENKWKQEEFIPYKEKK
jgi:hypothetical protein